MRRRRGNNEGSIYQRADGRWCATITIGYGEDGKRRRRTVFGKTKKDVQANLAKLASQKLDGTLGEPSKLTVAQFLRRWIEDTKRPPNVRYTTYVSYTGLLKNHIAPYIGGIRLSRLNAVQVRGLYAALQRDGVGSRTRQMAHDVLKSALKQAVKWGMLPRNVCDAVEKPKRRKQPMQYWTPEEAKKFLAEAAADRWFSLYVVAVTTGMRLGEILGLQWDDVDLEAGTIAVQHNLILAEGNGWELAEPKSDSGRRLIELPKVAVDALHAHRKESVTEGHAGSPFVFCDSQGGYLRQSNFTRRSYKPLLKRAGVREIRFHDLRHTMATMLLLSGEHPKVVQERLGHGRISMTLDTYSHVLPSMQKEAAAKLDRLFA